MMMEDFLDRRCTPAMVAFGSELRRGARHAESQALEPADLTLP